MSSASVPIKSEPGRYLYVLTRFLSANRHPLRSKTHYLFVLALMFLALRVRFWFLQEIGAVHRREIIGQHQRESDLGQHSLHHPAEGGIFVAHMRDHAVVREIVVLDVEIRPLLDVA